MAQFETKSETTVTYELRVVAVREHVQYENGLGHVNPIGECPGRLATASDIVAVLKTDPALREVVLLALAASDPRDTEPPPAFQEYASQQVAMGRKPPIARNHRG